VNACTVCRSDRVAEADAMLAAGRTLADVVRVTGLDRQALGRHRKHGHVVPPPAPPSLLSPMPRGTDPLANLRADLELVNAMDPSQMSASAAMALFAERRRLNEAVARLDPPVVTPPEVPTVAKFIELLDDVISRHPEEREKFMTAWKAYKKETA
jgi:hypothetical protein